MDSPAGSTLDVVDRQLSFSILQLVALSLPAFAILLQMVVESEKAYTHWAVPVTTAGMGLFLLAGGLVVVELLLSTAAPVVSLALGIILVGLLGLLVGVGLIGVQTFRKQRTIQHDHE